MKQIYFSKLHFALLLLISLFGGLAAQGQTTLTTGLPSSASSGSGANYYITFTISNNNPNPITITSMDVYRGSGANGNTYSLYYSSTSLSGQPSTNTTLSAPTWNFITSAVLSNVTTTAIHPTFSNMNFSIPANTTYRFAMQTNASMLFYGGSTTTPNSFTSNGVTIGRGNFQINSLNVGYWGMSTNPRFWCGTIVFTSGPPCTAPSNLTSSGITMTSANFNWNAVTGSQGYQYAITTTSTPPTTGTNHATNSFSATGLNNGTNYWFHVRNVCTASSSQWVTLPFSTVACPAIPLSTVTVSNITTISANLSWTAITGSQGYEYSFGTNATPPTSGTTQSGTTYNATGLLPGTTYYFHVRNKCASPSNSVWTTRQFNTLPCPPAGAPTITSNTPGSVTFTWPGTSTPGVANYQWAVTTSAGVPSTWNTTSATTATDNSLVAGSTYFIHVRSNCSNTQSTYTPLSFANPFPPCASPASTTISNVNMHGADITWSSSANVVNGYQYALTTSAIPPTTGLTLTTDTNFSAVNLVGGQKYYFYVRTHCGSNINNVSNLSPWTVDSFTTPLTCLATISTNVTGITTSSANIQWTKYPGILGYEYVINTNATPPPASFTGAAITFHTLAAANLMSGTNYYFHIRVRCDSFNYSPWTSTAFNTPPVCNTAPSTPVLTAITPTTATFAWSAVSGAQQYQYSVSTNNVPNPNSNTFTSNNIAKVLGLNPNAPYFFHIRAYCSPNDLSEWETVPFSTVAVSVNSIASGDGYDVIVYPNPAKDLLNIEISGTTSGKAEVMLYDLTGKQLKQMTLQGATGQINISDLPQGVYLLRYRDEQNSSVLRVKKM